MEAVKELATIRKKLRKTQRKYDKLEKQEKKAERRITQFERSKSDKDRATFIHNLQVSNVPNLLKRDWWSAQIAEPEPCYTTEIRAFVFGMSDLFSQITSLLGPMECFCFSRTSKSIHALLKKDFGVWALQFLARIELEIVGRDPSAATGMEKSLQNAFVQSKNRLVKFNATFEAVREKEPPLYFLHHLYASYHAVFAQYRMHGKRLMFFVLSHDSKIRLSEWFSGPIFIYSRENKEVGLATDYNILFSSYSPKELAKRRIAKFKATYGFMPIPQNEGQRESQLTYLRYDDLSSLNLCRASREMKQGHPREAFFIQPEDNQLVAHSETSDLFYFLELPPSAERRISWKGPLFHDFYECRTALENHKSTGPCFFPKYISDEALSNWMLSL